MLEFERRSPASVANPDANSDVLFLDNAGVFYTKDSAGALTVLGRGIVSIAKTGTSGLVDTYTITFSGGTTQTYTVTNGDDGRSIVSIDRTSGNGAPGTTDTYTITYSEAPLTSTFTVYNGANGLDGSGQPAANPPSKIDPDDAAATGTRTAFYALEDHQHQIDAATAVGLNGGSANGEGTSSAFARADHTHAIANGGTPSTITPDATANQGASTSMARSDHTHAIAADVPVALGAAAAEGTSSAFARADHVHVNPVIAHEAAADPHPQYTTTAEASAAAPVQSVAAGTGISVNATTGNVTVTNAGVTSVSVNGGAAQTGAVSIQTGKNFTTTTNLTAATPATITHNLGLTNKDTFTIRTAISTGEDIQLKVISVNTNSLTIESAISLTGVIVVVMGF